MKTDINSRMKAEPGDKLVEMSCDTCEFNFGNICAGDGVRTDNQKVHTEWILNWLNQCFRKRCADYGISLGAFIEQGKMNNR